MSKISPNWKEKKMEFCQPQNSKSGLRALTKFDLIYLICRKGKVICCSEFGTTNCQSYMHLKVCVGSNGWFILHHSTRELYGEVVIWYNMITWWHYINPILQTTSTISTTTVQDHQPNDHGHLNMSVVSEDVRDKNGSDLMEKKTNSDVNASGKTSSTLPILNRFSFVQSLYSSPHRLRSLLSIPHEIQFFPSLTGSHLHPLSPRFPSFPLFWLWLHLHICLPSFILLFLLPLLLLFLIYSISF